MLAGRSLQSPSEKSSGSADSASHPLKSLGGETSLLWKGVTLCGWGDTEGTDYKGNAGVIGENCFVCVCVRDLAEEMSKAEVEIHQDEVEGSYEVQ